jgi:type VI protein secretion system component Hcp
LVGDPRLHTFGRSNSFPITAGEVLAMGPLEEFDLTYTKIQWIYKGGTTTANTEGKWNLKTNSAT